MKNRIITISNREIKKSFKRFLSILAMSLLGVMVFVGIEATSPSMIKTLDNYYDKTNTYDLKIISTLGLTNDDISELKNISQVKKVIGSYSKDYISKNDINEYVIKYISINDEVNKIELLEGRYPLEKNEIVIEKNKNLKINDQVTIDDQTLTIVGIIKSPLFINYSSSSSGRGNTSLKTGIVDYYAYALPSFFENDYFTEIYLTIDNNLTTTSKPYVNLVDNTIKDIEAIKEKNEQRRYQELYDKAMQEIIDNENKVNKELNEAKEKLDSANNELKKNKNDLDTNYNKISTALKQYGLSEKTLNTTIKDVKNNIDKINFYLRQLDINSNEYKESHQQLQALKTTLANLTSLQNNLNNIYKGYEKYNKALNTYQNNLKEYEQNEIEANDEIDKAKNDLKQNLKKPTWYIYNRTDDSTYKEFNDSANSITNLAKIFPIVFYGIAVLVSLISMQRMVEDDRSEIGTLKSLGFNNRQILLKYLSYSFFPTVLGGLIGIVLGFIVLPPIVWKSYKILFDIPNFNINFNFLYGLIGISISIICICGTTIFTTYKVLKEVPASLMRPKPPKDGKRIFLERITILWNRLNFSRKITIRNLMRYKKRVLVTVIGIMGCTGLILVGFGIRDSIVNIATEQFTNVFKYDALVYLNEDNDKIFENDKIINYTKTNMELGYLANDKEKISINILVPDDNLDQVINLIDIKTKEIINIENDKIIISDKVARLLNVKKGDNITLIDNDNKKHTFEIQSVIVNYVNHYVILSKETYEKYFKNYKTNVVYFNTVDLTQTEKDELASTLVSDDSIMSIILSSNTINSIENMFGSLDYVVFVLIIFSAVLSFVVFYNLSNINISERKREIATLKVLGFYDHEVDQYITKENIILTFIGIILGFGFGYGLYTFIIETVEIEYVRFVHHISFSSCLYSAIITIIFTVIVNIITHFSLKKIDMIESLKSVE